MVRHVRLRVARVLRLVELVGTLLHREVRLSAVYDFVIVDLSSGVTLVLWASGFLVEILLVHDVRIRASLLRGVSTRWSLASLTVHLLLGGPPLEIVHQIGLRVPALSTSFEVGVSRSVGALLFRAGHRDLLEFGGSLRRRGEDDFGLRVLSGHGYFLVFVELGLGLLHERRLLRLALEQLLVFLSEAFQEELVLSAKQLLRRVRGRVAKALVTRALLQLAN